MAYRERLLDRQSTTGRPVRVGLVGAGQMGRGFVAQVRKIAGMEVVAVADIDVQRATGALKSAGIENVTTGDDHDKLTSVVAEGGTVAVNDSSLLTALPVDMVIDATGVPEIGAQIALRGLLSGKHVGLLNVETDITVGWLLSRIAAQSGAVYTLCRGDEPAETLKLVEFARDLAFDVVCAGKGKNNPLRPHDTPTSLTAEANSKKMNPKMLCSFVDGSKAMIEMAALANAADLGVSKRGMSGHQTTVPELHDVFKPAGRRRHPRPQRRGRLRHRPGRAGRVRRRPQRRAHGDRGDGLPRHGRRARTTPSTAPTTWPASRRRCRSRPRCSTGSATSTRAPGARRSPPARSGRSRRARPSTGSAASTSTA